MSATMEQLSRFLPIGPVNVGPTERVVTGGIGGALLLLGLDRGGGTGTALAAAGGLLLVRAVSGHCPAYQAINRQGDEGWAEDDQPHAFKQERSAETAEVLSGPHPDRFSSWEPSARRDQVEEASAESFPASDPPAYYKVAP